MDRQQQEFHKRLEGLAKNECVPQMNRNYLSDKFTKELRKARDAATKNTQNRCPTSNPPCIQVLKSNLPYSNCGDRAKIVECPESSPKSKFKFKSENPCVRETASRTTITTLSRLSDRQAYNDQDNSDLDTASRPQRRPLSSENIPPYEPKTKAASRQTNSLEELEEKVDFLNTQAQQLLKQLRREHSERERIAELYDEALDEVRRLRERDRPSGPDLETRLKRLECERDEAYARVRTAQVDNEEMKMKLERISDENQRDRQRWADKVNTLENRLHSTEADRDELARQHNRSLEVLSKMEVQQEEQKAKLTCLEEQKQDHLKQIENLGSFVKDLEQTTKQLQDKLDDKRNEMHQISERMTEMENVIGKVDQHMQHEKDRFIQMQNDAYQAQVRNQEVRTELWKATKKKSSSRNNNCD